MGQWVEMNTEKKLELLREIRMESQKNHQLMEDRQRILGIPVKSSMESTHSRESCVPSTGFRGLRFRILGALCLLGGFVVFQKMDMQYRGIDAARVIDEITRTVSVEQLINNGRIMYFNEEAGVK